MSQSRRDFLRQSLFASAAAAFSPLDLLALNHMPGAIEPRGEDNGHILVLGAGLSGLAAAYEMLEAGHEVTVLEARTRPGGRIRTLRAPFAESLRAEGSAARIPESHELVFKYADLLDLEIEPFQPEEPNLFYLGEQVLREDQPDLLEQVGLAAEEQELGPEGLAQKHLGPLLAELGDPTAPGWPDESLLRYDSLSGTELMRSLDISNAAIRFFDAGYGLFDKISGLELLMQVPSAFDTMHRIVGGMDHLPNKLAAEVSQHIRYGTPVVKIHQDTDSVTAICERAGSVEQFTGDRLICTLPFSVLRDIEIAPAVSEGKRRAIEGLHYESITRIFVQTRERFWRRQGLSGFAMTDHPMEIWDASYGQPGRRGILMAYLRSDISRKVAAMPEEERIRFGVDAIAEVFPEVKDHYEGAVTIAWDEDPWTRGAYAAYHPGDFARFYHHLSGAEGRIHFAGEHVSPWPGWMQGALHSGIRAAQEVNGVIASG